MLVLFPIIPNQSLTSKEINIYWTPLRNGHFCIIHSIIALVSPSTAFIFRAV